MIFAAEEFREKMLEKLKGVKGREAGSHHRNSGYTGEQARDHGMGTGLEGGETSGREAREENRKP